MPLNDPTLPRAYEASILNPLHYKFLATPLVGLVHHQLHISVYCQILQRFRHHDAARSWPAVLPSRVLHFEALFPVVPSIIVYSGSCVGCSL